MIHILYRCNSEQKVNNKKNDHVLKKVEILPFKLTPVVQQNTFFAAFVIPFDWICHMAKFWKKVKFRPLNSAFSEVCEQNIYYNVAAFEILFKLIFKLTMLWKNWILTFWSHPRVRRLGWMWSLGKKIATMLLQLWFHLILYAIWPCYENNKFDLLTPSSGLVGGLKAKYLPPCCYICDSLQFLYVTWLCSKMFKFDLLTGSGGVCKHNICDHTAALFATILLHLWFPLIL